ncbi:two-component sensor protein [Vibrio coralliilyticus]|uniref:histidine kinase n=1 Tax=Vibrio coralliilyticus TaxID=190893 RepID=A0A7Y4BSU6_9VIBR|nr:envelope stress sensor histidine kinase CpxA [Vibrio coralliilyticus]KJY68142.1 two-component sensor protein [Vibrio coralliilyticus]NOI32069.1 envelope stress sensor histidine kinase CpxA [Vibrio coralliilyticus]NOI50631.1 envelope stress sensor histidine kinase CpxA [Vibrio coralliilyticus]QIJ83716.1 envelope stress sensor histidine kinase CpxA [Vibrio coralliilyticus OCN008]QOU29450.1 envelope stress sensor histidine kinase CpxA [Vibrio coralliilyticus]
MRLPKITSLYGRIFAIFWFTMFLVLIAVLSLPHLDPRKSRDIPADHYKKLIGIKQKIEKNFAREQDLRRIIFQLEGPKRSPRDPRPRFVLTDLEGNILTTRDRKDFKLKAVQNFITSIENPEHPKQRLYGHYMVAGPLPITLAQRDLLLYVGMKWNQPSPFLIRLFDKPFQLLFAVMLVSTPLLLWLAWALSQPARKLERAAKRVAKGEFFVDPQLEKGTSEFRQAGKSFNQMVEAVNQMISGQQRLLSDISHELRSPLTRLRMATALASRKQGESPELNRIDTEAQRLEQMIGELLELSRMQVDSHVEREQQPIGSLWEAILSDAQFEAEQMNKTLRYDAIPERTISGNPKLLMSAVDNIVRNAIYYGKDVIQVSLSIHADQLTIAVDDNGEGVPEQELEAIFRPFYRVSTARDRHSGGTGLGLAITENAIRQHSGSIQALRSELGGLRIEIRLPLVPMQ